MTPCRHRPVFRLYAGVCYCRRCGQEFGPLSLEFWWALFLRLMHVS